jgi:hypothetical protein
MGRHADQAAPQAVEVSQEEQKQLLDSMSGMARKAVRKVFENLVAEKLCYMCLGRPGEISTPLKVGDDGKCVNCLGKGRVADFEKNKWAVNEILARKIPMPKAIEMKLEDKTDKAALAQVFLGLSKQQVLDLERGFNKQLELITKSGKSALDAEVVDVPAAPAD